MTAPAEVAPAALVAPFWRQARLWLAVAAVLVVGAVLVGALTDEPTVPLDPASTHADGSRALVHVLRGYGIDVTTTTSVDTAAAGAATGAVVVTAPDDYSAAQLQRLAASAGLLVLVRPGVAATAALDPALSPDPELDPLPEPGCVLPGPQAAGRLDRPADALAYTGDGTTCYGGLLVFRGPVVVLGSSALLQNDTLAGRGVAALDVNVVTADRTLRTVTWLSPGADAGGSGPASIWDLFPGGAYRAFWWLVAVAVLAAVWRARRLGGVVREPLPVVVRSAELVEGHGRLYARAGARDRAATVLRAAATRRITARLSLPRGATPEQVGAAAAPVAGRPEGVVVGLLGGPPPPDDAALIRLATDLDRLEAAVDGRLDEGKTTP